MVGGDDQRLRRAVLAGVGLERRVAVRRQQRALDERARHRVADLVRQLPAQRPRAQLARAAQRGGRRDPRAARRRTPARSPQPIRIQRRPAACAWVIARNSERASPDSTSAPSAPSSTSCGMPLPSNTPTTIVSAPVSGGSSVVARTSIGRRLSSPTMPKTVILGTARTPVGKLGGGLSSLKATELGGIAIQAALERADVGARAGPARRDGPGAAGRRRARSRRARRRSAPGSRRRSRPRRSTRSARRACAPPASSTPRSARATSTSRVGRRHGVDVAGARTCSRRRASARAWAT